MIKSYIVDSTFNNMRFDRWLRIKLGKVPQGLIEKTLRSGKIKLNKKKVKSSFKIKTNDKVDIFNFIRERGGGGGPVHVPQPQDLQARRPTQDRERE